MSRARQRRIILPDGLSSRRRPGPTERDLPNYRDLSAVLRAKELVSQWQISEPAGLSDLQLREALSRTLAEHSYFGYIRDGSKLPRSHPKPSGSRYVLSTESGLTDFLRPNGTDWLGVSTAPATGNWSVIPREGSRLFVFDLDVQKEVLSEAGELRSTSAHERYLEARRSIGYLNELLGADLRSTYAQLSPSGGVHIFVLLPEGTDPKELPSAKISDGMRALAGIPRSDWATELRGDLRSGASNGFILMAGSRLDSPEDRISSEAHYRPLVSDPRWSDFKDYRSARKLRLLELPEAAVERLREARRMDLELRASSSRIRPSDGESSAESSLLSPLPRGRELRPGSYSRLLKRLADEPPRSFHEARAQIYRALSCCGSSESIAAICSDAGYGKDSYSKRELSLEELISDMESMERKGLRSVRCGSHCGSARIDEPEEASDRALELMALAESLRDDKLEAGIALSALSYRRAAESSVLEARAAMSRRAQRAGDFGIYGKRNPLGLNYGAVVRELLGDRSYRARIAGKDVPIAGYRLRALELAVGYFAPLFSAGASVAIAPASELMGLFGWSRSQLREALRFLRSSEVISLERRQVSGMAPGYGPGAKRFYDAALGRKLRAAWGESRTVNEAGEVAFLGGYFDHSRGRIVRPDGTSYADSYLREIGGGFTGLLRELSVELPRARSVASAIVSRYLSKALARYLELSSPVELAEQMLQNLTITEPHYSTSPISEHELFERGNLWTSAPAFREHRTEGIRRSHRPSQRSQGSPGDRSPPDPP